MQALRVGDSCQVVLIFMLLGGFAGCRQHTYDPRWLPAQYVASPPIDVHSLDLTSLAQPRADNDVVRPGDLIGVTVVTGAPNEQLEPWLLRVAGDGRIEVPLVGSVMAGGLSLVQLEDQIRSASIERGFFQHPTVAVTLDNENRRSNRVTVTGAVQKQDTYELPASRSDLLAAIVRAGGLSEDADVMVEIRSAARSNGPTLAEDSEDRATLASYEPSAVANVRRINLVEQTLGGRGGVHLEDGSVVMVTRRPKQFVHVLGLVASPQQVEMPSNQPLRMLEAIALAGGLEMPVANKVYIVRKPFDGNGPPIVIESTVAEAKRDGAANLLLAAGDVISVEQTPQTFVWSLLRQFISVGFGVSGRIP